jgi:hypothetical protein
VIANVTKMVGKKCCFKWERENKRYSRYHQKPIKESVSVPVGVLLNVEAYTLGDYHQFFDDPRTRCEYLQWAPLLLAAEDFHAGKLDVGTRSEA